LDSNTGVSKQESPIQNRSGNLKEKPIIEEREVREEKFGNADDSSTDSELDVTN